MLSLIHDTFYGGLHAGTMDNWSFIYIVAYQNDSFYCYPNGIW